MGQRAECLPSLTRDVWQHRDSCPHSASSAPRPCLGMYVCTADCSLRAAASCFGACDALGMSVHHRLPGAVGMQAEPCAHRAALCGMPEGSRAHFAELRASPALEEDQEVTSLGLRHCEDWVSQPTSLPSSSSCPENPFAPGVVT